MRVLLREDVQAARLDGAAGADAAAEPDTAGQFGVRRVADVVLRDVAAQPDKPANMSEVSGSMGTCKMTQMKQSHAQD